MTTNSDFLTAWFAVRRARADAKAAKTQARRIRASAAAAKLTCPNCKTRNLVLGR